MDAQSSPVFNYGHGNVGRDKLTNVGNVYSTTLHQNILVEAEKDLALQALFQLVVPEAMHDSKEVDDQGTCHPGTRTMVIEDIVAWIERADSEYVLKWMKGAAGAGKSAIARTIAKILAEQGLLLASFFCIRSHGRRSDASSVIPTLVNQIITRIPSVRPVIEEAFRSDPYLLTKTLEIQARCLIVEPLASIEPELRQTLPRVIVIDGLDEIGGDKAQCDVLKTIAFFIDTLTFPIHFLVASRPEHQIQDYFTQSMGSRWSPISLDDSYHPDRDIIIFYKAHFPLIVAAFPSFTLGLDWPREEVRQELVKKGSGQFIFAAIVIRFLGDTSIAISPEKRLDMILQNVATDKLKPLELLDLVYVTVFEAVPKEELQDVLQLVGLVLLPVNFTKSPQVIDAVLCLEPGTTLNRLRYLHSILKVPTSFTGTIAPLHATLGDFVFDQRRSHSFGLYIDHEEFHQGIMMGILKGSMIPSSSERLAAFRDDWFLSLYANPISRTIVSNPTFRNTLASHFEAVQRIDIKLWPHFALSDTYRVALQSSKGHSSWPHRISRRNLEKRREKEVLRRWQSHETVGRGLVEYILDSRPWWAR